MSDQRLRLAVIMGSVRDGRFCPTVARWFVEQAEQHGSMDVDLIDPVDTPLSTRLTGDPDPETQEMLARLTPRLDAADAFVIVTPEYNHGYSAALKSLIDWHYTQWRAKPIGFVSYGGIAAGLRAVEQLRLVFSEMHAATIRDCVSFPMAWEKFDEDGQPFDPASNAAAKTMLDQLDWWAQALRTARDARPYLS